MLGIHCIIENSVPDFNLIVGFVFVCSHCIVDALFFNFEPGGSSSRSENAGQSHIGFFEVIEKFISIYVISVFAYGLTTFHAVDWRKHPVRLQMSHHYTIFHSLLIFPKYTKLRNLIFSLSWAPLSKWRKNSPSCVVVKTLGISPTPGKVLGVGMLVSGLSHFFDHFSRASSYR